MKERNAFFQAVLPSMLAFALSGVYAIVDGFFLGHAMGDHALAAVNMAYPITAFLQAVGTGIGMGVRCVTPFPWADGGLFWPGNTSA